MTVDPTFPFYSERVAIERALERVDLEFHGQRVVCGARAGFTGSFSLGDHNRLWINPIVLDREAIELQLMSHPGSSPQPHAKLFEWPQAEVGWVDWACGGPQPVDPAPRYVPCDADGVAVQLPLNVLVGDSRSGAPAAWACLSVRLEVTATASDVTVSVHELYDSGRADGYARTVVAATIALSRQLGEALAAGVGLNGDRRRAAFRVLPGQTKATRELSAGIERLLQS